jgi:hypothetical protein
VSFAAGHDAEDIAPCHDPDQLAVVDDRNRSQAGVEHERDDVGEVVFGSHGPGAEVMTASTVGSGSGVTTHPSGMIRPRTRSASLAIPTSAPPASTTGAAVKP